MTATYVSQDSGPVFKRDVAHYLPQVTADCISSVCFSPRQSPLLLVGASAWDGSCTLWQLNTSGPQIQSIPFMQTQHEAPILAMSMSHDGRVFFGGCSNTAVMWNLQTNQKSVVGAHDMPISALAYLQIPQVMDNLLITTSWDGRIRWWDLRQQNFVKEENLGAPIFALDATRAPPMMAVAQGRDVHIYDMSTMTKFTTFKSTPNFIFNIRCISCAQAQDGVAMGSSEGRIAFSTIDGKPKVTAKVHCSASPKDPHVFIATQTNFCFVHPKGPSLVSGGGNGKLSVYNMKTKGVGDVLEEGVEQQNVLSIAAGDVYADNSMVAVAYSYDWAQGKAGYKNQQSRIRIVKIA